MLRGFVGNVLSVFVLSSVAAIVLGLTARHFFLMAAVLSIPWWVAGPMIYFSRRQLSLKPRLLLLALSGFTYVASFLLGLLYLGAKFTLITEQMARARVWVVLSGSLIASCVIYYSSKRRLTKLEAARTPQNL